MTDLPEVRVRNPWPARLHWLGVRLMTLFGAWGLWRARPVWTPPAARGAAIVARGAGLFARRFSAEAGPVFELWARKLAPPAPDASARYVAADRLSMPEARRRRSKPEAGPEDIKNTMGAPVLVDRPDGEPGWLKQAGGVIAIAAFMSLFFGIWAWWRGAPRSKTFT